MRQSWKAADRRMNTVNELFQNIRFLKFYGWGGSLPPFSNQQYHETPLIDSRVYVRRIPLERTRARGA